MEWRGNYSLKFKNVLRYSCEELQRLGNQALDPNHMFLGLLREGSGEAVQHLEALGVNLPLMRTRVEAYLQLQEVNGGLSESEISSIPLYKSTELLLKRAVAEAYRLGYEELNTEHLLLAMLQDGDIFATQVLRELEVDYRSMLNRMQQKHRNGGGSPSVSALDDAPGAPNSDADLPSHRDRPGEHPPFHLMGISRRDEGGGQKDSATPTLDAYSTDLTRMAREGQLDPVVGRQAEIERISQILSRRKKNNPILIGEPGVGKTAIVEGLAQLIAQHHVPRSLMGKRIVALDMATVVAGTKYRGQFEERMVAMLAELAKHPEIILFIDELHTIVGTGSAAGSLDTANIIKPALARGDMRCIGATTLNEYREHIEKDGALERRFQRVLVEPTSPADTLEILRRIAPRYQEHHNVHYQHGALEACVSLTSRYINERCLPDKAIDALDEAGARVHTTQSNEPESIVTLRQELEHIKELKIMAVKAQQFEHAAELRDRVRQMSAQLEEERQRWEHGAPTPVTADDVAAVVAQMTGVPVQRVAQSEVHRLLCMGDELKGAIVGQDQAIAQVVKAIQRNRSGVKHPNKPIGTFIFLGPTGVGKTQLAKVLTSYLFDSPDNLIRIDMSEYMEKFSVSRLMGAPPGYVGYEEGGQLTERVRRRPYSVVLLDEVEKAHPDVFHLLLQVMDEGRLTDSLGRVVDFKNTIIIMTSNIGSRRLMEFGTGVGFATKARADTLSNLSNGIIDKELRRVFSPEFLNRIDDIIMFNTLSRAHMDAIIDIELRGLYERLDREGIELRISPAARAFIAEQGYDRQFGARPLKRAIQKHLEDPLAELLLQCPATAAIRISVGYSKSKNTLAFKLLKPSTVDGAASTPDDESCIAADTI